MNADTSDNCLEHKQLKKYADTTLSKIINEKWDTDCLHKLTMQKRNELIKQIYNETDVSIRQLSRILGIGKEAIEKAIKQDK